MKLFIIILYYYINIIRACGLTRVSRQLWDLYQGKTITEFTSHTAAVSVVQFHPNEYLLASGSSDRCRPRRGAPCCFCLSLGLFKQTKLYYKKSFQAFSFYVSRHNYVFLVLP